MIIQFCKKVAKAYDELPLAQSEAVGFYEKFIEEAEGVLENVKPDMTYIYNHPILPSNLMGKLNSISHENPYEVVKTWKGYKSYFSPEAYKAFTTEYLGKNMSIMYGGSSSFAKMGILSEELFK